MKQLISEDYLKTSVLSIENETQKSPEIATTTNEAPKKTEVSSNTTLLQANTPENITPSPEFCAYENPAKGTYSATIISVRKKLRVKPGETYQIKIFLKNTGTTPWFSKTSGCEKPVLSLGLDNPRDRSDLISDEITNRIVMDQFRVLPGEIASFTFFETAPKSDDIIKEFYTPVVEGVKWLDSAQIGLETYIGKTSETPKSAREKISLSMESGSVLDIDLSAPRKIVVDISEQKMFVYLGDKLVKNFRVSSGKSATPTPYGETKITLKQEVRVSAKAPHYIMPKFMMFRAGGYGIHALPSLGNDRGRYWTEARSHIGIPVSHGCIRLLPEDADFLFDFTPIGTPVVVKP
jgi:lipoprotein-anchoring transpeptidase ErfK/SrfK